MGLNASIQVGVNAEFGAPHGFMLGDPHQQTLQPNVSWFLSGKNFHSNLLEDRDCKSHISPPSVSQRAHIKNAPGDPINEGLSVGLTFRGK